MRKARSYNFALDDFWSIWPAAGQESQRSPELTLTLGPIERPKTTHPNLTRHILPELISRNGLVTLQKVIVGFRSSPS
jgi:hypothetical protein